MEKMFSYQKVDSVRRVNLIGFVKPGTEVYPYCIPRRKDLFISLEEDEIVKNSSVPVKVDSKGRIFLQKWMLDYLGKTPSWVSIVYDDEAKTIILKPHFETSTARAK